MHETTTRLARLIATACLAVALCALAACSKDGSTSVSGQADADAHADETWTVLVYLCGSNLESQAGYATDNLAELQEADCPDNVTFVVETGGADEWQNQVVNAEYLERYLVKDGQLHLQEQLPRVSMGSADTFADFVTWGVEAYPADRYMLVFWDHGGGSLSGVCQDELDLDTLTLPEISAGLKAANVRFDVVGFDTCLMATLETAQILAPYADYLVASEEVEPACGWAWGEWPQWFNEPAGGGADLGKAICDSYYAKCESSDVAETATLSVIDLSLIGDVSEAFEAAAQDMALSTEEPGRMQRLVQGARDVHAFGHANYLEGYTDMVDLRDLMACMDESLSDAATEVQDAVDKAVVYEVHGPQSQNSYGLSVFYPLKIDYDTFADYFALSTQNNLGNVPYLQYLATQTGSYDAVDWAGQGVDGLNPVEESDANGAFAIESRIDPSGRYVVDITGNTEWIAGATFSLGQLLDDGTVVMLGSDNNMDLSIDSNTGAVHYADRFDGGWYKIGEAYVYADIVDMVADGDGPLYNLYSTPVEWTTTNRGKTVTIRTNLLSMYSYRTNAYTVLCVYEDADESGMVGKSVASLQEGDQLKFLVSRQVNGQTVGGSTGTITWTDDTEMTVAFAGNATYVYLVTVTDLFGNEYTPDPALITYDGNKRSAKLATFVQR